MSRADDDGMTTITTTKTTADTTHIDTFLDAVAAGHGIPTTIYADHAVLDATVPNWRFRVAGPTDIAAEYSRWFADEGRFEELERHGFRGGELVTYTLAWEQNGVPYAAHHAHVLLVDDDGRIERDTVFCGGRWDASLLAQMAETVR
jgi:hypothetical protein